MKSLLIPLLLSSTAVTAISVDNVVLPKINLEALGSIGLVGEYDGISTYNYKGQQNSTSMATVSSSNELLISQVKEDLLAQTEINGQVLDMCKIDDVVYFAGKFTKVGDSDAKNIASINSTSGQIQTLDNGPKNGSINALYCDDDKKQVYVGGSFAYNDTQGVALWDADSKKWSSPLFGGFSNDSVIESITKFGDNIVFAGSFDNLANESFTSSELSSKKNYKKIAKKQRVSFGPAQISAEGSADGSDPKSIICSNSKGWQLTPGRGGTWRADFPYYFTPTRMRLYNLEGSNGVNHLNFRAFPLNGILNMTFTEKGSSKNQTCNADCQLPKRSDTDYVDYVFPNGVKMNSFQIQLIDYYGDAAGLGGIELYSSEIVSYAQNSLNEAESCEDAGKGGGSEMKGSGWESKNVEQEVYESTTISDASQLSQHTVTFQPNVTVPGNYSVDLYTPGCVADGTCAQRGQVSVKLYYDPDKDPITTTLWQNNDNQKFDTLYTGPVKPMKGDYRPRVEITPVGSQNVPLVFVAQRVQFNYVLPSSKSNNAMSKRADDSSNDDSDDDSSEGVELNAMFEFERDNFTKIDNSSYVPVSKTTINGLFSDVDNVQVNSISSVSSALVIGGKFTADFGESFAVIKDDKVVDVAGSGLNGEVQKIVSAGSKAYVLGSFTATKDGKTKLNYAGIYDPSSNKWSSLGSKLSQQPQSMATMKVNNTDVVAFSGPGSAFNLWVVKEEKWLEDSSIKDVYMSGRVSSSLDIGNNTNMYAGSLRYLESTSPGGAFLSDNFELSPMPFTLEDIATSNSSNGTSLSKRAAIEIQQTLNGNSINVGTFANKSTSILGGHFKATNDGGNSFSNVLIMNDGNVTGLTTKDISQDSAVYSLLVDGHTLYVGGDITGADDSIGGLMFYNLNTNKLADNQPPALNGGQGIVTTLIKQPQADNLIVMGSFEQAGSLGCQAFCVYDLKESRWNQPSGGGLSGTVSSGLFIETEVMFFAGDMKLNGTSSYFAKYDFSNGAYTSFKDMSSQLPGPVNTFVLNGDGDKSTSIFAAGLDSKSNAAYLAHWDNSDWKRFDANFEKGSTITDLKLVELKNKHDENDVLPGNQLLLVSGNLVLKDFGNASCVMFDGKEWQPLFLTSNGDSSGTVNSLFSQTDQQFGSILGSKFLAKGFVVLISLAIAVGLILLLVALGLLISYWRKRRQGYRPAPNRVSEVDMTETVPPANLFEEMGNVGGAKQPVR